MFAPRSRVSRRAGAARLPKLAKEARIQGTVRLAALINRVGEVERLRKAAMDAVKQWRYRPMIVSGVPVSVATEIDVNVSFNAGERDPIVHV
jgi:protein TonB